MIAILKINDYKSENAMIIPINLIQNEQDGSYVFVAEKGNPKTVAKKLKVKMGQSYNGLVEITEGLKSGDIIITAGQIELQDGETVRL
jgi:multidrug efflux pump subunit AcrA (membrane-fusion protein)